MKTRHKAAIIFIFAIIFIGTSSASMAITQGLFELGALVPFARYDTAEGIDTVVGIAIDSVNTSQGVYWSFHSASGERLASGFMGVRENTFDYSFSLAGSAGGLGEGVSGYLVFVWNDDSILQPDDDYQNLSANSFLVDLAFSDAAFLPVIPLIRSDFADGDINLLQMTAGSLVDLFYGVSLDAFGVSARYLVNPEGDDPVTTFFLFFPSGAPDSLFMTFFSTSGDVPEDAQISIASAGDKVVILDVGSMVPAGFTEGSVFIESPFSTPIGLLFALAFSSEVGAEQTLLGVESL